MSKLLNFARRSAVVMAIGTLAVAGVAAKRYNHAPTLFLKSLNTGLCLQPTPDQGSYLLNNLPIIQTWCNPNELVQQWHTEPAGTANIPNYGVGFNVVYIKNNLTGQCLDNRDGSTADRGVIQQYTCNTTSTTMKWAKGRTYNGFSKYVNARSGKCLDIPGGSNVIGLVIQQYKCTNSSTLVNDSQLFNFTL